MSERFEGLPEEKQKKIIDAAIEEFALNGYERASTNSIVKKAGISKGILFHYFGSKKNLFLYLLDYSMEYFIKIFESEQESQPKDVIERLVWRGMWKVRLTTEYPMMSRFTFEAYLRIPEELKAEMMERYSYYYSKYSPFFMEGIDTSTFRKGIDPKKAMEFIMFCIEGLSEKYMKVYRNRPSEDVFQMMDQIMAEFREYLDLLKYGIYNPAKDSHPAGG